MIDITKLQDASDEELEQLGIQIEIEQTKRELKKLENQAGELETVIKQQSEIEKEQKQKDDSKELMSTKFEQLDTLVEIMRKEEKLKRLDNRVNNTQQTEESSESAKNEQEIIEEKTVETKTEDNIDSLTPEEETRVAESLKHTELELSEEELKKIRERTELEYNSIKANTTLNIKITVVFIALIFALIILVKLLSGTQQSRVDTIKNADSDEAYTINATDFLDGE
jgi:hypothetical protein